MKKIIAFLAFTCLLSFQSFAQEYYEIRNYYFKQGANSKIIQEYFSNALIPALNRQGVEHVGVFKVMGDPNPTEMVMVIPFKNLEAYIQYQDILEKDSQYLEAAKAYFEQVGLSKPLFEKISTYFSKAFNGFPHHEIPVKDASRIYEWRTYESYNEDALRRKVKMFDDKELDIFKNTGLHRAMFSKVLAGENTPCLSYLISFKNMEERDTNWKNFGSDPDWRKLLGMEEYANSHSRTVRKFLIPVEYSQW